MTEDYSNKVVHTNIGGGTTRHHSIDVLKTICAFLVVCIHAPFPGEFGEYFISLTRIAVPIFFMISGYYWTPEKGNKQIKKVLLLTAVSNSIYFLFGLCISVIHGRVVTYISVINTKSIIKFIVLNESPVAPHLWYLGAILYVLIIFQIVHKAGMIKWILYISPFLLFVDLLFGKYSLLVFHREFPYIFLRNWLFVGIPFFAIGYFISNNRDFIKGHVSEQLVLCGIIIMSSTTLLERYLLVCIGLNAERDQYISTVFLSIAVFIAFLFFFRDGVPFVAEIGRKDSTWIYVLHVLVIMMVDKVLNETCLYSAYSLIKPVYVFVITTIIVETLRYLKTLLSRAMNR